MYPLPPMEPHASAHDLAYLLRRAEQESIAEIRAVSAEVAGRHGAMARAYATQALVLLDSRPIQAG